MIHFTETLLKRKITMISLFECETSKIIYRILHKSSIFSDPSEIASA